MSQHALIWICVSAISLNNNRRITITCDLRDWIRYITNSGGCRREPCKTLISLIWKRNLEERKSWNLGIFVNFVEGFVD